MVTRKKLVMPANAVPPTDPDDASGAMFGSTERPSPVVAGEQDSLMSLLAGFTDAAEVTVKVYRVIKNRPLAYVFECSPESFNMDDLRDVHNGGEFRVYIHKGGELIKNVRVMVETKQKAMTNETDTMIAAMREQMARQDKMLEALLVRSAAPAAPPSLGAILGGLDLPATIAAIGTLLQVLRPPAPAVVQPPPADPSAGIDLLLKGIELAKELKGDSGGEAGLMDVVRDLVKSPMLAQAVASMAPQASVMPPPSAPMRPPQLPRPAPAPTPPVSHAKLDEGPNTAVAISASAERKTVETVLATPNQMVPQYMGLLTAQAAAGSDPDLYAGLVLDQMDDDTILWLLGRQPDAVSALIADYPPAEPHRAWFEELVSAVRGAFDEEGEGAVESDVDSSSGTTTDALGPIAPVTAGGAPTR